MSDRKIRMVAGPNGSGKSTLLEYLRREYSFPLGYCQNPDEIEKELSRTNRLDFAPWGLNVETEALTQFFRAHPLAKKAWDKGIEVEGNVLRAKLRVASGYFAAVLSDFMRQ